jgi:quinol monooxygenase YgiN
MIHVIAIITTKPGQREAVLAKFRDIIAAVRAEEGCIEYGPAVDIDGEMKGLTMIGPDSFMVIEKWTSQETLAAHAVSAHMAAYGASVKDLVASRAIHVLDPAE